MLAIRLFRTRIRLPLYLDAADLALVQAAGRSASTGARSLLVEAARRDARVSHDRPARGRDAVDGGGDPPHGHPPDLPPRRARVSARAAKSVAVPVARGGGAERTDRRTSAGSGHAGRGARRRRT